MLLSATFTLTFVLKILKMFSSAVLADIIVDNISAQCRSTKLELVLFVLSFEGFKLVTFLAKSV